jgi:protein-tyrosine phosphatase
VIDLHCHILPGLDDGPVNFDFSVAMAQAASDAGIQVVVATPHIRDDYDVDPAAIPPLVRRLNEAMKDEEMKLLVLSGGEVALPKVAELDDATLSAVCLGSSDYVLLESPYKASDIDIEGIVEDVQERGFKPLLAHPERCPIFQHDPDRLKCLVNSGVLCSITAASLAGGFGSSVRRFTLDLVHDGLVHDVASDAHDHLHRPPYLLAGFDSAEAEIPGISVQAPWFTVTAPVAILAGRPMPARPDQLHRPTTSRWRRLVGRGS